MAVNGKHSSDDNYLKEIRKDAKKRLYEYVAPKWAEDLRGKPKLKIDLFQKRTPILKWFLPQIPSDFEIYIKRDDLTGGGISGHKIRRLEFHLAEALATNCDTIICSGCITSNNCRTVAVSGKELGFNVHLSLYKTLRLKEPSLSFVGNYYINMILGAHLYLSPEPTESSSLKKQIELKQRLSVDGYSPYIVRSGQHGDVGLFGYIDCFEELITQGVTEKFSDLVLTCGSGLTAAGFIIGNYRNGGKLRLHAYSVNRSEAELKKLISDLLKDVNFLPEDCSDERISSLINIEEESSLPDYCVYTDDHVEFVSETAKRTGILLDPIYTGKTAYHMVKKLQTTPETFQGKKILFYNTGSVISLMTETFCRAITGNGIVD